MDERDEEDGEEKPESQDTLDTDGEKDEGEGMVVIDVEKLNDSDRLWLKMLSLEEARVTGTRETGSPLEATLGSSCSESVSVLDWSRLCRHDIWKKEGSSSKDCWT